MTHFKWILFVFIGISLNTWSQVGGNQVYRQHHSYGSPVLQKSFHRSTMRSTDSTLILNARILLNQRADRFEVTVGVQQEGETIAECNQKMNDRIKALIEDLNRLGIKKEEVYVDFIAQTRIYDHEVGKTQSTQVLAGFELKKNVIFILKDNRKMDQVSVLCAKQEIYDIVKVEYIHDHMDEAYTKLYEEAISFIKMKKDLFLKVSEVKLKGNSRVSFDNFFSLYPKNQYVNYEAFESSDINLYSNRYSSDFIQKEARKHKTFYYDGTDVSTFDKVIQAADPEVGIQYVLEVEMIFELEKTKS